MRDADDDEYLEAARRVADGEGLNRSAPASGPLRNLQLIAGLRGLFRSGRESLTEELPRPWGPLVLEELIGQGGFGTVYRARDTRLERDVALKLRREGHPVEDAEFVREARRLARVRHPHVLAVHGVETRHAQVGLWCELIDGQDLEALLASAEHLGETELLRFARELAGALAAVHDAGLVHGDVKAANVMRERGGRLVLMDFGAAHAGERPRYGSPRTMAPECLAGEAGTTAADVYSLGNLLYRLATRRTPHEGADRSELLAAKRAGPGAAAPLGGLSRPLRKLILAMLSPEPTERPDLSEVLRTVVWLEATPVRRLRRVAIALAAGMVVLAAGVLVLLPGGGRDGAAVAGESFEASVAVLPFATQPGESGDLLATGLPQLVLQRLASEARLRVAARASSFPLAATGLPAPELAARLGVDALLTGSVQRTREGVRVTAELVDGTSGFQRWSAAFEQPLAQLPGLEHAIAAGVIDALLGTRLPGPEPRDLPPPATFERYLRALDLLAGRGVGKLGEAIDLLAEVVDAAPAFAPGWSALATAYVVRPTYTGRGPEDEARAAAAARRTLELAPADGRALAVLATLEKRNGRWRSADRLFREALRAEPSNADTRLWYGELLAEVGRWQDSRRQTGLSVQLDPQGTAQRGNYGWALLMTGDRDAGLRQCETAWAEGLRAIQVWQCRLEGLLLEGRFGEARAWLGEVPLSAAPIFGAYVTALEAGSSEARLRASRLVQAAFEAGELPGQLALFLLAALDAVDPAFAIAAATYGPGRYGYVRALFTVEAAPLRADPRFVPLVERLGLVRYWESAGWPDMCRPAGGTIRCDGSGTPLPGPPDVGQDSSRDAAHHIGQRPPGRGKPEPEAARRSEGSRARAQRGDGGNP